MLKELRVQGLLDYDDGDKRYSIGTRLWEIGELSDVSLRLRETALPYMLELYEAAGENVHLAVLSGVEALYVARLIGHRSVPTVSRMGGGCRCTLPASEKFCWHSNRTTLSTTIWGTRWQGRPPTPLYPHRSSGRRPNRPANAASR